MFFTQKTLSVLGFDKIREMVAERAATDGAKNRALSLMPSDDFDIVVMRQNRTAAARRLLSVKGYPPFSVPEIVMDATDRAEKGATLNTRELLAVATLLHTAHALADYISSDKNFETCLDEVFRRMIPNRVLEQKIGRTIVAEDIIADEASPELADIRRKIRAENNKIKDTLQNFVGGARSSFLQENLVTMRDGRYVIPVKSEHRNEIKGLLHDTSASGATVFIEPMAVVDANNELRLLHTKEELEIERILSALSADVSEFSGSLRQNYHNATELAYDFACASLAEDMRASMPVLVGQPLISLKHARHPLLDRKKVVPVDVALGEDFKTLIITGPNTGGKTVTLKTLGLFAFMAQSGLQIPADDGSRMGVFGEILVDIGDDQSTEQSLSTFSSHMVTIVDILKRVTARSLSLFDELGAGTDPVEGAALAIAVLEKVRAAGGITAATTHYAELKAYAIETDDVQNASCEFDIETLRPTYRLIIGAPGKSNAFAISEKLGLDPDVIRTAEGYVSGDTKRFENVIEKLEISRRDMEKNREESERLRREYEQYKRDAEIALRQKTAAAEKEIEKDREKAHQLLVSARATSDFVMKQLEEAKKHQESLRFAEELGRLKGDIRNRLRTQEEQENAITLADINLDEPYTLPRPLRVGDKVYMVTYAQEGVVEELPDKKNIVIVRAGIMRAKVPLDKLRLLIDKKENKPKPTPEARLRKTVVSTFSPELDVRGMYGDDAWFMVDKYLDDATLAGIESVRIIHGKGTGALRKAIWTHLKGDPRVTEFRSGVYGEGDTGVTVIKMK